MREQYGIILLDKTELIVRIYAVEKNEWRLLQYFSKQLILEKSDFHNHALLYIESILDVFTSSYGQQVSDWKICGRGIPEAILREAAEAIDIEIENLLGLREQELLCKGMFTELW